MSIEKIQVNGKIYDIRDVEDVKKEEQRALSAEADLKKRLQGLSEKSDSRKDPFKYLGPSTDQGYTYEEFNSILDELLYTNNVVGFNSGYFRARVNWCEMEVRNIVRSNADQLIIQVVSGAIQVDAAGKIAASNDAYSVLFRKHSKGEWSGWRELAETKKPAILAVSPSTTGVLSAELAPNTRTIVSGEINTLQSLTLQAPTSGDEVTYQLEFTASISVNAFNLPTNVKWANKKVEAGAYHVLKIVAEKINGEYIYKGTLTAYL